MSEMSRRSLPAWLAIRRSAAALALSAAAFGGVAATASAAESELVGRGDGVNGAFPIERAQAGSSAVASDGKTVYFVLEEAEGGWAKALGLYRRDVVTNRTTLIVKGAGIRITSLSSDGRYLGFSSPIGHVGSDTNKTIDLYGYDASAQRFNLVSRADGVNGKPLGVTSGAYITRDGKSALIGTKSGVVKRDLVAGKTTKIGDGRLAGSQFAYLGKNDGTASADGRVYWVDGKIVTPRGSEALPGDGGGAPLVSPSGRWVLDTEWDYSGTVPKATTTVIDTTNGNRQTIDPFAVFGDGAAAMGFTPSDTVLVRREAGAKLEIVEASLTGAAPKVVATYPKASLPWPVLSETGKFALSGGGGPVYLWAPDGASIPGGADLPSPGTFLGVLTGCRASGWPFYLKATPSTLTARFAVNPLPQTPPAATSLSLRVVSRTGAVVTDQNVAAPGVTVELPAAGHPYAVTASAKYPDGRSTTESWSIAAPGPVCSITF